MSWYYQLSATRGGEFGPAPLTFQEIAAWHPLMEIEPKPTPWEVEQLLKIDSVWFKVRAEAEKKKGKS